MAARLVDPDPVEDLPAEPDDRDGERVDLDVDGQDDRARGVQLDERRRAARGAERDRRPLGHEARRDELADEAADGAAGEPGLGDEVRAGEGTARVELADDRAQVRPADRFAALPEVVAADRQGICVPLFQTV